MYLQKNWLVVLIAQSRDCIKFKQKRLHSYKKTSCYSRQVLYEGMGTPKSNSSSKNALVHIIAFPYMHDDR